jgi:hypothetical protein
VIRQLMTVFAFPFPYFIKNIRILPVGNVFVAFHTGYILMLSVELKCSGVVVEVVYFPVIKYMTFLTCSDTFVFKLFTMDIHMTVGTRWRHR